ncbi:MAG: GNAT family N-acetyltransferase, partial [Planctomycetes bacterium]|nr:GNAT family N-acetyltransferase [Planctomycetota bacterium]
MRYYDGDRIYLRPVELADEPLLRRWFNDPENWRTLQRFGPINEQREREFIEELYKSPDDLSLGIVVQEGDVLVGVTGLHGLGGPNRSATFGIALGEREYQGRGFGTEATRLMVRYGFEELNLNRIGLTVFAGNERGIRTYRRSGFVREGCLRQTLYRNGRYQDELCYSILRSEWERSGDAEQSDDEEASAEDDGVA